METRGCWMPGGSCMTGSVNEALLTFIVPEDVTRLSTGCMVVPFTCRLRRNQAAFDFGEPRSTWSFGSVDVTWVWRDASCNHLLPSPVASLRPPRLGLKEGKRSSYGQRSARQRPWKPKRRVQYVSGHQKTDPGVIAQHFIDLIMAQCSLAREIL